MDSLNSQRKTINNEESWQWWLTFIGEKMQHNYYLYYIIDNLMVENPNIKGIVEIGTGYGALSTVLGLWGIKKNIPVLTVDHRKLYNEKIFKALKISFFQVDEFSEEIKDEINLFIDKVKGPILFICDGGDKIGEFNLWVPLLPFNSIVAAHDWGIELNYSDIEGTAKKYCIPLYQEEWNKMNVQFAVFKKRPPFLSIVTRHLPCRIESLSRCKFSIEKMKDKDFEHIILEDDKCLGITHANEMFFANRHLINGKYVFILDDDDILMNGDLVSDLKEIAEVMNSPEVVFVLCKVLGRLYPTEDVWEKDKMIPNHIGSSCFVVLNSVWQENIEFFKTAETPGDYNFINAIFLRNPTVFWQGKSYVEAVNLQRGKAEV